ncbi:MAG: hypothetical protein OEM25_06870 [Gammaproteobacteria bacterium]|nr:hypothetical protein [Gammaproteobacteria bacterium]
MSVRMTMTSLLGGLAVFGCATEPLSVQERDYQRADAAQTLVERFDAKTQRCRQSGGHMVLIMGNTKKIDRRMMVTAYCETRSGVLYEGYGT